MIQYKKSGISETNSMNTKRHTRYSIMSTIVNIFKAMLSTTWKRQYNNYLQLEPTYSLTNTFTRKQARNLDSSHR